MHASIAPHRLLPASRMFSALLLSTSRQEARRVLNITLREISKVVGPKPKVGLRLPEEERKRWMGAFSTWLMVYVLPQKVP